MNRWLFALLLAGLAGQAQAMRCGNLLVHKGDTRSQVLAKCGEPVEIVQRTVRRERPVWLHGRRVRFAHEVVETTIEYWIYNLGPNRFMRRVRFDDEGVVAEIESLGRGYTTATARAAPLGAH
jgi:hypothetical protein